MDDWVVVLVGLALGVAVGAGVMVLWSRSKIDAATGRAALLEPRLQQAEGEVERLRSEGREVERRRQEAEQNLAVAAEQSKLREQAMNEQRELLDDARTKLRDAFMSVGAEALKSNSQQFIEHAEKVLQTNLVAAKGELSQRQQAIDASVKPIRELLEKHATAVSDIEKKREVAYTKLESQMHAIAQSHQNLNTTTSRLLGALRRPEQRGRWGEMQLRNAVEMAGMTPRCDFHEQVQTDDPNTADRPDMTVSLPGGGVIVVDSKVALDAYLDALETDGEQRTTKLNTHASLVERHYRRLAAKKYWAQFDRTPKLVVMFMPLESALVAALEQKPDLHAAAMENHVLIATPTLLVALLRAVAYGWQQEALAENAREISIVGKELYDRLATFVEKYERIGRQLTGATRAYNESIGSLERSVLPSSRKLRQLHVTTEKEVEAPPGIEVEVRDVVAPELNLLFDQHDKEEAMTNDE